VDIFFESVVVLFIRLQSNKPFIRISTSASLQDDDDDDGDDDGSLPEDSLPEGSGSSLALTPPGDEMSEVVSRCLPHR